MLPRWTPVPDHLGVVAVAEAMDVTRIFTLDRDFHVYRWKGRRRFAVVPGDEDSTERRDRR